MFALTLPVLAQSLDDRLDHDRFLDGLIEYGLDDLVEHVTGHDPDDPAAARLNRIGLIQTSLAEAPPDARRGLIDSLIEQRRALLAEFPRHERRPLWKADLAFDLMFLVATEGGRELLVEFGIADEETRRRVGEAAAEALDLADEAAAGLADLILDLEEHPAFRSDTLMQQRRRRLVLIEQRQRIPFIHAAAAYLAGLTDPSPPVPWARVGEELEFLAAGLTEPWRSRARALLAGTLARLDRPEEASQRIAEVLVRMDVDATTRLRAKFLEVEIARREGGDDAALALLDRLARDANVRRDPFAFLLVCDQRFLTLAGPTHRNTAEARSLQGIIEHIDAWRDYLDNADLPLTREERESIVAGRWRLVLPANVSLRDLRPDVALAEEAARRPEQRSEAMRLLADLLEREGDSPTIAPRLMFAIASLRREEGHDLEAARMLLELAERFPVDHRAPRAAEAAAALAAQLHREQPDSAEHADLFDRSLRLVTERFPSLPEIDRWAFERGAFEANRGRLHEAIAAYERVEPGSALHVESRMQIATLRRREHRALSGPAAEDAARSTLTTADRARRALDRALAAGPSPRRAVELDRFAATLDILTAEAHLALGELDAALALVEDFEDRRTVPDDLLVEAIELRLRIHEAAGDQAAIERDLRDLARRMPQRALLIVNRITATRQAGILALEAQGREDEASQRAARTLLPLAELGWSIAQQGSGVGGRGSGVAMDEAASLPDSRFAAALRLAEAYRLAERYEQALLLFEELARQHGDLVEVVLGLAECLFHLDRHADAMPHYQRLSMTLADERPTAWWLAELRMLQALDDADRRTERIYPRIQRLRLMDQRLGGPRFAREFAMLEQRYAP